MRAIDIFSLVAREGDAATHAELWAHGRKWAARVPGTCLEAQFQLGAADRLRYLLLTSYDCPFEEMVHAVLLNQSGKILETATRGGMYTAGFVDKLEIVSADTLRFDFLGPVRLTIRERPKGLLRRYLCLHEE